MSEPWLDIIGATEAGVSALDATLRHQVATARTVFGPPRLLAGIETAGAACPWTPPLSTMIADVLACRNSPTVVLATGDPNWFGIGATLGRHLRPEEFRLHPAPGAFQLAAARLKWPLHTCQILSFHGRPVASIQPHVLPGNRLLALTANRFTLDEVRNVLAARGYGPSQLFVLENLGADNERITRLRADAPEVPPIGDFYTLGIECAPEPGAELIPPVPGLPDSLFEHDGQLTKREVRAMTLSQLAPFPGALLWDIGAGSGSVGIEWMRAADRAKAVCFERDAARCSAIARNAEALGVPNLTVVQTEVPAGLVNDQVPDAVFMGGGVDNGGLFEAVWTALRPGGVFVANAVTLAGREALFSRHKNLGGHLIEIAISRLDNIGAQQVMRPKIPVLQWAVRKPEAQQ